VSDRSDSDYGAGGIGVRGEVTASDEVDARPEPREEMLQRLGASAVHSPVGIAVADLDGKIEWANEAFSRISGYGLAELSGRNRFDLLRGPVAGSGQAEQMRADLAAAKPVVAEFETRTRDGRPYWSWFMAGPGYERGELSFYVFVETDITEQRRNAEAVRKLVEDAEEATETLKAERELLAGVLSTIPHVVFWKDTENRYLGCNGAYARLRGVTGQEELAGRRESDLDAGVLGSLIAEVEGQVLETGTPVIDHFLTLDGVDGGLHTYLLSVLPRHTDGPIPGGVIGVGTDVTRITALERQLAQATRLESIGQLAAGLAHEINTPVQYVSDNALFLADSFTDVLEALRAIANVARGAEQDPRTSDRPPTVEDLRARLQLLVDGLDLDFLSAEIPSALEQTLEGVGRVAEIVRAMKEFSHPGQGRVETDLNHAIETTIKVSRNEWKYVAELDVDLGADVGLVPCFEGELKQVVLNLIVNAAHAIAEHHQRTGVTTLGRIGIMTRRAGETVQICISDDGTGMDEQTKLRIFDPFFTTKEVGKGTGQGLAMAHSCIVGKHGGTIDVISAPGAGTTFRLNLPAIVVPSDLEDGGEA
jgi:two-component system NtrC family sensor kinase